MRLRLFTRVQSVIEYFTRVTSERMKKMKHVLLTDKKRFQTLLLKRTNP